MEDNVLVKLTELRNQKRKIETRVKHSHEVGLKKCYYRQFISRVNWHVQNNSQFGLLHESDKQTTMFSTKQIKINAMVATRQSETRVLEALCESLGKTTKKTGENENQLKQIN